MAPGILRLFALIFLWNSVSAFEIKQFQLKPPRNEESVKVAQIIINFMEKYFVNKNIFLSILHTPEDSKLNTFQNDLILNLVTNTSNPAFSFSVMEKPQNIEQKYKKALTILLIPDAASFA